jgi:hypothetical protein
MMVTTMITTTIMTMVVAVQNQHQELHGGLGEVRVSARGCVDGSRRLGRIWNRSLWTQEYSCSVLLLFQIR